MFSIIIRMTADVVIFSMISLFVVKNSVPILSVEKNEFEKKYISVIK